MPSPIYGPWLKDGVRKQMRLNLSTHMDYLEGDLFADRSYFVHEEFVFRPQLCMLGKDIKQCLQWLSPVLNHVFGVFSKFYTWKTTSTTVSLFCVLSISMTGVGGRPEVIIEGSNDLEGPWMVEF